MYDAILIVLMCMTFFQLGRAAEAVRNLRKYMEDFK